MKRFTRILICLLLCVVSFSLVACDNRTKEEKAFTYPSVGDPEFSNGGLAVRSGNYLYFVNGFKSVNSTEHVQEGEYVHGALMLVKLTADGEVVKGGDLLTDEYYITMSEKLCGFEATNLFIAGEYLYFTSTCQENLGGEYASNGKTEWAKNIVDFNRIKLDKSSDVERVYRSEIGYDALDYEYYASNGNVFILIHENGTNLEDGAKEKALMRVDCNTKSTTEIARGVSSVDMKNGANIVFANSVKEGQTTKYNLKKYNIFSNSTEDFVTKDTAERTVKFVGDNYAYATYKVSDSATALERYNLADKVKSVVTYSANLFEDLRVSETGNEVIAVDGNKFYFLNQDDPFAENPRRALIAEDADATSVTIVGLTNGCVIYLDNNNNLKSVSYSDSLANEETVEVETIATLEGHNTTYFDYASDDQYLYFYKKVGGHEYLHRIKIVNNNSEAEEMVGVYIDGDAPTVEE